MEKYCLDCGYKMLKDYWSKMWWCPACNKEIKFDPRHHSKEDHREIKDIGDD